MRGTFTVGGSEFSLSRAEVESRLAGVQPEVIREIAVTINGAQYPVKQALAAATGLLRGNFTSHEAMRVFRRLSFPMGAESAPSPLPPARRSIFEDTEEILCPDCNKPYTFRTIAPGQMTFEGCNCEEKKTVNFPPGSLVWTIGNTGLGFLRVPKHSA